MIFSHVSNILNSCPLSGQGEDQLVLNANQLTKPYLSNEDQEIMVSKFLEEVFNDEDKHLLFKKIFGNNHQMAATASQVLKVKNFIQLQTVHQQTCWPQTCGGRCSGCFKGGAQAWSDCRGCQRPQGCSKTQT